MPLYVSDDFVLGELEISEGLVFLERGVRLPPGDAIHVREELVIVLKHVQNGILLKAHFKSAQTKETA